MVRKPTWRRRRSPSMKAANERAARAAARPYLTGEKVRRYESPQMIAQHGRDPWPPKKAAAEAYRMAKRNPRVEDQTPTFSRWLHRVRKQILRGKSKRTGGTWTLRKANVSRSKSTGRFKRRG
jgi:hypothetical protein